MAARSVRWHAIRMPNDVPNFLGGALRRVRLLLAGQQSDEVTRGMSRLGVASTRRFVKTEAKQRRTLHVTA